ncbi:HAMP domain-containing sensor histidine kinase [Amycolatopsis sp. 195334CR]|uniref:HAMP domain-containing sensor histidine kinase n=1 Tax=Amycolatopsis sp. 195334CR TaxID=2814588 RepID=UPI001A8FAF15|nr:HAMP domain-containing sensor histidine kinase [Amycolatopsis sp. 195334CR]MBN6038160.1 HAMP domain-containing histidine kinase [Amycolatopsis sp. 195334CR]
MSSLRTTSLRRRVTLTALLVVGVVLVALGFTVSAVFTAQGERNLNALLTGRVQLAQQLARENVAPANLVRRIDARGVVVSLRLPSGDTIGAPEPAEGRRVTAVLNGGPRVDGAELVLTADTSLLAGAERTLARVLVIGGLVAIVVTGLALLLGMRVALRPLDRMTALARSIASGSRGGRLSPSRPDTELGRTAEAFDEMLDALEASEDRMRTFVADAAHELRTPIAGVRAAAEAVLELGPEAAPDQRERLELLLVRESQRAGRLVEDLLDLARIDAGVRLEHGPVRLRELAHTQADRLRLLAPSLTVTVTGPELEVSADEGRITQILANLADNARNAAGDDGTIEFHCGQSAAGVSLTVTDSGPGVPEADRERIFGRLVRLDTGRGRDRGGSGLGLTIARGLARAHGGELTCHGAAFRLTLPRE